MSTYNEWINFLFERHIENVEWRFDEDIDFFEITPQEVVHYTTKMLVNYKDDIDKYSDWQIATGIEFIFNNSFSDYAFYLRDKPTTLNKRLEAIDSIKLLYKNCFNERCKPTLGHLLENDNELNNTCYMMWDTTPLAYCEDCSDRDQLYKQIIDVLEFAVSLSNIACIESGLHGLGHLVTYYPEASNIISKFIKDLKRKNIINKKLLDYAERAKTGSIQ